MARNRKAQTVAVRFGPAVKACVLCLLIGGTGVGYVWQKEQIVRLGQEYRRRELRLLLLEKDNEKLRKQLAYSLADLIQVVRVQTWPPRGILAQHRAPLSGAAAAEPRTITGLSPVH